MGRPEKIRLGEILVQQKLLTEEQLKSALDEQKKSGRRLGRVVIDKGFVTEEQISEALARQLNIPYINLKFYNLKREVTLKLPESVARRYRAVVLDDAGATYKVGMADPTDLTAYDEIVTDPQARHRSRRGRGIRADARHRPDLPAHRADHRPRAGAPGRARAKPRWWTSACWRSRRGSRKPRW